MMKETYEPTPLPGASKPLIVLQETRFEASDFDSPCAPPPYSSMIDDVFTDIRIHKRKDELRQIALSPIRLKAGQSELPCGGLGRHAVPVSLPELRGGRILSGSV